MTEWKQGLRRRPGGGTRQGRPVQGGDGPDDRGQTGCIVLWLLSGSLTLASPVSHEGKWFRSNEDPMGSCE